MRMKSLRTLQRRRILMILKVMWYRQGWHRFKPVPCFDNRKMVFLPLSAKIRSRFWSCQILVCQKKEFSPSAPSALSQANFCEGSSTSGSLHLFFNGVGLKLGSLHLSFSGASPKLGALCTFSSTLPAPRRVLLLPEL